MRLRPVSYTWKVHSNDQALLGFIAQEVEGIVPEAVVVPKSEDEYYAMKYEALIPVLTKAIQEQQREIEILRAQQDQMIDLKEQNQMLQTQITDLYNHLQTLQATTQKLLEVGEISPSQINK